MLCCCVVGAADGVCFGRCHRLRLVIISWPRRVLISNFHLVICGAMLLIFHSADDKVLKKGATAQCFYVNFDVNFVEIECF